MTVSAIVAMSRNGVIGHNQKIPWKIPLDLRRFRDRTEGYPVIMGKNTALSLGEPLPMRENVVISRKYNLELEEMGFVKNFPDVKSAMDYSLHANYGTNEIFFIGGGALYILAARKPQDL